MIILDREDQDTVKLDRLDAHGRTIRLPERVSLAARSTLSLPDYETSQALYIESPKPTVAQRQAKRRLWRTVVIAMAVYIILTLILVPILVVKLRKTKMSMVEVDFNDDDHRPPNFAVKLDLFKSTSPCDGWTPGADPLSSSMSFTLQPSGSLFFRSDIPFEPPQPQTITGSFNFDVNPDDSVATIQVSVTKAASNATLQEQTHVCFKDIDQIRGLSLYVPGNLTTSDRLNVTIDVLFPKMSPVILEDLYTTLPMFHQQFGDLAKHIKFRNVVLQGSGRGIVCESLNATQIDINTSLGPVIGDFSVTHGINIDNIGGPIHADVVVQHKDAKRRSPSYFVFDTGNSDIVANITLVAGKPIGEEPRRFNGNVKNFNGKIDLNVLHHTSSAPSPVDLRLQNSAGYSQLSLDRQFTGYFDAQTKMGQVTIDDKALNQSSRGPRVLCEERTPWRVRGWVGSTKPTPTNHGRVDVLSSLSDVRLKFGAESKSGVLLDGEP